VNILIISDDQYYSSGVLEVLHRESYRCSIRKFSYHCQENTNIRAEDYDLTVIDIYPVKNIREVLPFYAALTDTIFAFDIHPEFMDNNSFFISKRGSTSEFINKLRQCLMLKIPQVRPIELEALRLSNSGHDMLTISSHLNISAKSIYRLRCNLMRKLGFIHYHPLMAVYCELMTIFFINQQPVPMSGVHNYGQSNVIECPVF